MDIVIVEIQIHILRFCPSHKGPFNNLKDLNNFIKSGFNETILNTIEPILNNIFTLFIEKINIYFNKVFENQIEFENEKTELFQMIKELFLYAHLFIVIIWVYFIL